MLRILLVEDHPIVRHGVRAMAEAQAGWEVCGECDDGGGVLHWVATRRPHILVLEVSLVGLSGVGLIRQIRKQHPATEILVFSTREDPAAVTGSLGAGARGYVFKSENNGHLAAAIAALGAGRAYLSPGASAVLVAATGPGRAPSTLESFTGRELQVAQMMVDGQSNKQIARTLGITAKTVETHRSSLMRKAEVRSAAAFVSFAIRNKLIRA